MSVIEPTFVFFYATKDGSHGAAPLIIHLAIFRLFGYIEKISFLRTKSNVLSMFGRTDREVKPHQTSICLFPCFEQHSPAFFELQTAVVYYTYDTSCAPDDHPTNPCLVSLRYSRFPYIIVYCKSPGLNFPRENPPRTTIPVALLSSDQ